MNDKFAAMFTRYKAAVGVIQVIGKDKIWGDSQSLTLQIMLSEPTHIASTTKQHVAVWNHVFFLLIRCKYMQRNKFLSLAGSVVWVSHYRISPLILHSISPHLYYYQYSTNEWQFVLMHSELPGKCFAGDWKRKWAKERLTFTDNANYAHLHLPCIHHQSFS